MSARLAPSSRPLPSLFVAFLPFFVLPWPSPLRVINVIIIIHDSTDARVTGRTDPDAPLKQWGDEGPRPARVDTPDPKLCPNIASIKQRTSPPATDTQRGLRSERGTPRSAPMHYLRTHAGQGMADRQGRRHGGRQKAFLQYPVDGQAADGILPGNCIV